MIGRNDETKKQKATNVTLSDVSEFSWSNLIRAGPELGI